jgi:hypothetical protein
MQTPTCAICEQAITKAQRFVLVATEAVHRTCATSGQPTRLLKADQAIAELRVGHAKLRRQVEELERSVAQLNRMVARSVSADVVARLRERVDAERGAKELVTVELLSVNEQRRQAMAECDRLRARIAELESPAPARSDAVEVDATELRFGLLELD